MNEPPLRLDPRSPDTADEPVPVQDIPADVDADVGASEAASDDTHPDHDPVEAPPMEVARAIEVAAGIERRASDRSLTEHEVLAAFEAIGAGLDALASAEAVSCDVRFGVISTLEGHATAVVESMLRGDRISGLGGAHRRAPIVTRARDVYGALLDAYWQCVQACHANPGYGMWLRACQLGLIGSAAERLKWEQFAGGPAHPTLWARVGETFRASCSNVGGIEGARIVAGATEDPVGRAFLKVVASSAAGFDQVSPRIFRLVDRLVDQCLPLVGLEQRPAGGAIRFLDGACSSRPSRIICVGETESDGWFLSTRFAVQALQAFANHLERGVVPPELDALRTSNGYLLGAVRHLLGQWTESFRIRRHRRHPVGGTLSVVIGLTEVARLLNGHIAAESDGWGFRNVSRGGAGATVPSAVADRILIGELVAMKPHDGQAWHLGIVRRVWEHDRMESSVGLETLATAPWITRVDDGRVPVEVIACDPLRKGEVLRFIVSAEVLQVGAPLFLTLNGTIHKLRVLDAALAGEGFEVWICQVL